MSQKLKTSIKTGNTRGVDKTGMDKARLHLALGGKGHVESGITM